MEAKIADVQEHQGICGPTVVMVFEGEEINLGGVVAHYCSGSELHISAGFCGAEARAQIDCKKVLGFEELRGICERIGMGACPVSVEESNRRLREAIEDIKTLIWKGGMWA